MDNIINISIADKDTKTQELILENTKAYNDINITNISSDGELCLKGLKAAGPDILIMDLLLPKVAGFEILDYIRSNDAHKDMIVIIMTALTNDRVIHKINDYNVEYVLNKPFNIDHLIQKARYLYRTKLTENADLLKGNILYDKNYDNIKALLINMGIKPHLNGFNYLKTAIYKSTKDINLLSAMTKELYPLVADIYETKPASVERSIRHALKVAYQDKKDLNKAIKNYGYQMKTRQRLTNSIFISVLSNYLRSNESK